MAEHIDGVVTYLIERDGPVARHVELNVDWEYDPLTGSFVHCRSDHIYFNETTATLYVDDLKYGWRIVEPDGNWTLLAYAIGYVQRHNIMPREIVMTIHQPRRWHPDGYTREWRINFAALTSYYEHIKKRLCERDEDAELVTGSYCHDCSKRGTCPALRNAGYNAIDVISSTVVSEELSNEELTYELSTFEIASKRLEDRLTALREIATHRLETGSALGDYILAPSYGHRRWKPGLTPAMLAVLTGHDLTGEPKLLSPAQAEKLGVSKAVVKALADPPFIGNKLVRQNADRRARKLFN